MGQRTPSPVLQRVRSSTMDCTRTVGLTVVILATSGFTAAARSGIDEETTVVTQIRKLGGQVVRRPLAGGGVALEIDLEETPITDSDLPMLSRVHRIRALRWEEPQSPTAGWSPSVACATLRP